MTAGQIRAPSCIPLRITPGNKQHIDDETPIELACDTPNTTIFYSLSGEKPVPFDAKSRNTYTYYGPFLLTPGKRTIKSVAAYPDGRQSNTVTKVYWVSECTTLEEMGSMSLTSQLTDSPAQMEEYKRRVLAESFRQNVQTLPPGGLYTANRAKVRGSTSPVSPSGHMSNFHASTPTKRSITPTSRAITPNRSGTPTSRQTKRRSLNIAKDVMRQVTLDDDPIIMGMPSMRYTKETEKCPQCFTDKPPNPLSKYCHQCGHYLPPNPVDTDTVKCLHCHSVMPADLSVCLVCSAVLTSHQLNMPTVEQIVCSGCRFKNPPNSKTCVVCEENLSLTIVPKGACPEGDSGDSNKRKCSKCSRDNSLQARYCDWCGSSMVDLTVTITCAGCTFQNPPLGLYCGNCASSLLPKVSRITWWSDDTSESRDPDQILIKPDPILISTDTQTDGLFYKSAKRLQVEEDTITDSIRQVYKSRGLSVTKFSAGCGGWRQNVEHITNHIKVYSQLNSEYQDIIGKPQFGKVTMATLFKEQDEIHLSYTFSCKKGTARPTTPLSRRVKSRSVASLTSVVANNNNNKRNSLVSNSSELSELLQDELKAKKLVSQSESELNSTNKRETEPSSGSKNGKPSNKAVPKPEVLSKTSKTNGSTGSLCSDDSAPLTRDVTLRKSIRSRTPKDMHELRIGKLNTQLLQEVTKDGDEQRVSRMLGQGADPNIRTSGGVSVLCLAAKHKHVGAVKTLVQAGANIHFTVPSTKDTALHIAVQQGALEIVKFLLDQGAKFDVPNTAGKTALEVARERHNQRAVQLFTASMGSNLLGIK